MSVHSGRETGYAFNDKSYLPISLSFANGVLDSSLATGNAKRVHSSLDKGWFVRGTVGVKLERLLLLKANLVRAVSAMNLTVWAMQRGHLP